MNKKSLKKSPLFQTVHLRLTFLCSFVTVLILILTSASYLYISEKNLREQNFSSFQNDMNTLLANFDEQTVITHEWLSKMEGDGSYLISIKDNGVDFLWGNLKQDASRQSLTDAGWRYYNTHFEVESRSPIYTYHMEFAFPSVPGKKADYYGCAAFSGRKTGTLSILILKPLKSLHADIVRQRSSFLLLIAAASVALFLFFFHFIKRLLAPIEESRKSQLRFVAAASHELRTPLSVILSAASACRKAEGKEQAHFFDIIRSEGESMSNLISDLLTLAGADSQNFTIHPESCELDTLLLDCYEAFESLAKEKGYLLSIQLPDMQTAPAYCDKMRIHQVLSILLHNAFSYTQKGSLIVLSLIQESSCFLLRVSDNGPGIAIKDRPHIFERFYRSDASRKQDGHFGLGLSIADEIMRAHHGSIAVSETPGGGATFTLTLPR